MAVPYRLLHLLFQAERGTWMWKCRENMEEKEEEGSDWKRASKCCGHRQGLNQNTLYWAGGTTLSIQGLQRFNPLLRKIQRGGRREEYLLYHKNTVQVRSTAFLRDFSLKKGLQYNCSLLYFAHIYQRTPSRTPWGLWQNKGMQRRRHSKLFFHWEYLLK